MIGLLAKVFITNKEDRMDEEKQRQSYGVLCSITGILLNLIVFAGKFFAGMITDSVAITADAFNNLSDSGSSLITLTGFRLAGKKPDSSHPFGHGRFEYISGFVVSIVILFMGFELAKSSVAKILHPGQIEVSPVTYAILLLSIGIKFYMFFYNSQIGKKIGSSAMKATAADSLNDMIATTVVLFSIVLVKTTGINIDGWCGVAVAIFIFYAGIKAMMDTLNPLLGQPPQKEFVEKIQTIVLQHPEITGIHDLIVHDYGPGRVLISLHAEVPGNGDVFFLHDIIDQAEMDLRKMLGCEAVIHMDPVCVDDEAVRLAKNQVLDIIKEIDAAISIHDFRMIQGPSHTNLVFDAVVPPEFRLSEAELICLLQEEIQKLPGNYYSVIHIDRCYV